MIVAPISLFAPPYFTCWVHLDLDFYKWDFLRMIFDELPAFLLSLFKKGWVPTHHPPNIGSSSHLVHSSSTNNLSSLQFHLVISSILEPSSSNNDILKIYGPKYALSLANRIQSKTCEWLGIFLLKTKTPILPVGHLNC